MFKGEDRAVFIDKREFAGSIYNQIEEAYQFVLKHINLGATIDGIVRKDRYELPPESIREAIINSVCHRCYLEHSCVQIAIYDNRVEITSPGMLYGGLTVEQAIEGRSKIRNVCIAELFSRMGIIEEWGTGFQRMIQGCREYGVRGPEFVDMGDAFRVIFYRGNVETDIENTDRFMGTGTKIANTSIESEMIDIESVKTGIEKIEDDLFSALSDTEKKVVRLILKDPEITQDKMAEIIGISKSGIRLDSLRKLVRSLQDENRRLKELLDKADIAYESENVFEEKIESIEEYEPDQGGRIQNKYITEELANKYFAMFWGRTDVYAKRGTKAYVTK